MYKVLVCDDDKIFLQAIRRDIVKIAGNKIKEIELFNDKETFEFYLADHQNEANIYIIDIRLGEDNGIELAERLIEYQPNSQIIFVSGYDGYYMDVYDVDHVYFLRKPVDIDHLKKALGRATKKLYDLKQRTFVVSNKQGIHNIPLNEILYFENERRRVHVHTTNNEIVFYGRFDDIMGKLDRRFMRCHNSYIVNISRVRELCNRKFHFGDEKTVPISKTYYNDAKEAFISYIGDDIFN